MNKTSGLLCALVALVAGSAWAVTPPKSEVPLTVAKTLALSVAQEQLVAPTLASARLYRNLDDQPAVWVLEFRSPSSDTPVTVVAAATRALPPLVMHWRGLPWHADPRYLAAAWPPCSPKKYQWPGWHCPPSNSFVFR